jgi:hypothetical protein
MRFTDDNRPIAPAGTATLTVLKAGVSDLAWRASAANPSGACLCLVLSAGDDYAVIRSDFPLDNERLLGHLADAVGCSLAEMTPDHLVGKKAGVIVSHFTGRSGAVKAGVGKWLPARTEVERRGLRLGAMRRPAADGYSR